MTDQRKRRRPVTGGMRVSAYKVLVRAIEEGVALGYQHAFKHVTQPVEEVLRYSIEQDVLNAICEVFDFNETED